MKYLVLFFQSDTYNKRMLPISLFLSTMLTLLILPFKNKEYQEFHYQVGESVLDNLDVLNRLSTMYWKLFIIIPLVFLLLWFLTSLWAKKAVPGNLQAMNQVLFVLSIPLIGMFFSRAFITGGDKVFPLYLIIVIYFLIFLRTKMFSNKQQFVLLMSVPLTIIGILFLYILRVSSFGVILFYFLFTFSIFIVHFISSFIAGTVSLEKQLYLFKPFIFFPVVFSVAIEILNILKQRFMFTEISPLILSVAICLILFSLISFRFFKLLHEPKKNDQKKTTKISVYYFWTLLGMLCILYQPLRLYNLALHPIADYFEGANHMLSVHEFITYGKIPILETFDAHMLANQFFSYIYYLLTGDKFGALFPVYYSFIFVLANMLLYLLYKQFFKKESLAFLLVLFIPFSHYIIDPSRILFIPAIFALLFAARQKSFVSYFVLFFALIGTCFIYLDLGFATMLSAMVTILLLYIKNHQDVKILKLFLGFTVGSLVLFPTLFMIAAMRDVNLVLRLQEFLVISRSDLNWALTSIGEQNSIAFLAIYALIPISIVISYIICFFRAKQNKLLLSDVEFIVITMLCFLYISNFHRGVIRHSLFEKSMIPYFTSILYFVMIMYVFSGRKIQVFLGILLIAPIIHPSQDPFSVYERSNMSGELLNSVTQRMRTGADPSTAMLSALAKEPSQRVEIDDSMHRNLKTFIDSTLSLDESFIDFTNYTLLYAFLEREKPVYVNQSPGLLSNEKSQIFFLEQITLKKEKLPLAITPLQSNTGFDDVPNTMKHYMVAEYLANNYKPYVTIDQKFILSIDKTKFDQYKDRLDRLIETNDEAYQKIDQGMIVGHSRNYNLKQLPYLWGEKSKEKHLWSKQQLDHRPSVKSIKHADITNQFFEDGISRVDRSDILFPNTSDIFTTLQNAGGVYIDSVYYPITKISALDEELLHVKFEKEVPLNISLDQIQINFGYLFQIDASQHLQKDSHYIINEISSISDTEITLSFGKMDENNNYIKYATYQFVVRKGDNITYAIRVSTDMNWSDNVDTIAIESSQIDKQSMKTFIT